MVTKKKRAQPEDRVVSHRARACMNKQPVSHVLWRHRDDLKPNDYNPNKVAPPELELLIVSILEDGFTQPIVVLPDMTIVDGFHRWTVSADERLLRKYEGMVPVVVIDVDPVHRKMSTVRHNRARGTHAILPMAEIVRTMAAEGASKEAICKRLGMEDEEFDRLVDRAGNPVVAGRVAPAFGRAWVPGTEGT
jgi:ParB-like chromosome segregation protein Spo0J